MELLATHQKMTRACCRANGQRVLRQPSTGQGSIRTLFLGGPHDASVSTGRSVVVLFLKMANGCTTRVVFGSPYTARESANGEELLRIVSCRPTHRARNGAVVGLGAGAGVWTMAGASQGDSPDVTSRPAGRRRIYIGAIRHVV